MAIVHGCAVPNAYMWQSTSLPSRYAGGTAEAALLIQILAVLLVHMRFRVGLLPGVLQCGCTLQVTSKAVACPDRIVLNFALP